VVEVKGKDKLEKIILNTDQELETNQLFIEIGGVPNVHLCGELNIEMENNFVKVDKKQATNVAGVFAAGDITNNPLKQIITAAAEGAIAATSAYNYLKNING
jgi:thioredoxin reductase (NADPH)